MYDRDMLVPTSARDICINLLMAQDGSVHVLGHNFTPYDMDATAS
jgi:hypothetical protein